MNLRLATATVALLLAAPTAVSAFPGAIADVPADLGPTFTNGVPRGAVITSSPAGETVILAPGVTDPGQLARPVMAVRSSGTATFTTTTGPQAQALGTNGPAAGAVGADGTTGVAAVTSVGTLVSVRRPGQPNFSTRVNLFVAGESKIPGERPAVAVTPTGRVLAFTVGRPAGDSQPRLAIISDDGTSATLLAVDTVGAAVSRGDLNVLADGTAVVAALSASTADKLIVRTLAPGADALGPATELTTTTRGLVESAVAPTQRVLIGWGGLTQGVEAAVRLPDGSVSGPTVLTTDASTGVDTRLRADGTTAITYVSGGKLWQATLNGDTVSAPTVLLSDTLGATDALVDTSPTGQTVAALATPSGIVSFNIVAGKASPPNIISADLLLDAAAFNPDGSYTLVTRAGFTIQKPSVLTSAPAPLGVQPPTVTGTALAGRTLSCTTGSWRGAVGASEFSWLRDGKAAGAGATYTVTDADAGSVLACSERRTNAFGATTATSVAVAVGAVAALAAGGTGSGAGVNAPAAAWPPQTSTPSLRGRARVGATLRCARGMTTGATRTTFRWLRGTKPIKGATKATRRLVRADRGKVVSCEVTARNAAGTSTSLSVGRLVT